MEFAQELSRVTVEGAVPEGGRSGCMRYEMRQTFGGASGYVIQLAMGRMMETCQEALAQALKKRVEGGGATVS